MPILETPRPPVVLPREEDRPFLQDLPLHPQPGVLIPQPRKLFALICAQPARALATGGLLLLQPVAQRYVGAQGFRAREGRRTGGPDGITRDPAATTAERRRDPPPHDARLYGCVQFCFAQVARLCSAVRSFDWVNTWTADCSAAACDAVGT